MNRDESVFKLRVKDILKEKNLTQKDLANMLGKSPQYIANVLNAEQGVSVNILIDFAKALNVEFRDLFAFTKEGIETSTPSAAHLKTCPHCGQPLNIRVEIE